MIIKINKNRIYRDDFYNNSLPTEIYKKRKEDEKEPGGRTVSL